MAMRIGVEGLYYALQTADDGTLLTYDTPVALPGVMKININPNMAFGTAYFDNGPGDTATTLGDIDVEIEKNSLTSAEKVALLGHTLDVNKVLAYGAQDTSPYVAIGFKTLKSNGKFKYVWLLKGKFADGEENAETKNDSISFQSDTIKGKFVKVNKSYTYGGKTFQPWKMDADEEDAAVDAAIFTAWFTAVYLFDATV